MYRYLCIGGCLYIGKIFIIKKSTAFFDEFSDCFVESLYIRFKTNSLVSRRKIATINYVLTWRNKRLKIILAKDVTICEVTGLYIVKSKAQEQSKGYLAIKKTGSGKQRRVGCHL